MHTSERRHRIVLSIVIAGALAWRYLGAGARALDLLSQIGGLPDDPAFRMVMRSGIEWLGRIQHTGT